MSYGQTSASIVRTVVKELPIRSFAPTGAKSEGIAANCASTTASCEEIGEIGAVTFAIFGEIGEMPAGAEPDHPEVRR